MNQLLFYKGKIFQFFFKIYYEISNNFVTLHSQNKGYTNTILLL